MKSIDKSNKKSKVGKGKRKFKEVYGKRKQRVPKKKGILCIKKINGEGREEKKKEKVPYICVYVYICRGNL